MPSYTAPLTVFQEAMLCLFLNDTRGLLLHMSDPSFNYLDFDGQLLRELQCGRLSLPDSLRVYKELIRRFDYVMTGADISRLQYLYETGIVYNRRPACNDS